MHDISACIYVLELEMASDKHIWCASICGIHQGQSSRFIVEKMGIESFIQRLYSWRLPSKDIKPKLLKEYI